MDEAKLKGLLARVKDGSTPIDAAVGELRELPFVDLGFAMVDHHRAIRQGVPEVILGEGKTAAQIVAIARELARTGQNVLVTRTSREQAETLLREIPGMVHAEAARTCTLVQSPITPIGTGSERVALVSAGTSDFPVAEECAETLRMLGVTFERVSDVGVAGIHRLFHKRPVFDSADVVIVVAGMEGALPSVVAGLVNVPVIAVPTSVGYGAAFEGIAALCGMLTSCSSGITVVNIDNGFGAAVAAARIVRPR